MPFWRSEQRPRLLKVVQAVELEALAAVLVVAQVAPAVLVAELA